MLWVNMEIIPLNFYFGMVLTRKLMLYAVGIYEKHFKAAEIQL